MQGASCTQRKVFMVPFVFNIPFVLNWGGSISFDSFLPSILLLVVIIIMVVIVVVILIVVVVVIVGVVIVVVIIGVVVVVGGVSSIFKPSFSLRFRGVHGMKWTNDEDEDDEYKRKLFRMDISDYETTSSWILLETLDWISSMFIFLSEYYIPKYLTHQVPRGLVHFPVVVNLEPLSKDILGATTQRDIGSYYPKRYWELLPKEILGAITQREIGMSYGKMEVT
ncbi:hypothetical protein Tco_0900788 [Tanacetum coccineum]